MSKWNAETAEWYAQKYGEYPTNRLAVARLELEASIAVLDIGCGTGAALREVSRTVISGRLVGADPVPRMVEIARNACARSSSGSKIEIVCAAAELLPLQDEAFDLVLAFDSIDHWSDGQAGFRETARVLKPEGRLAVVKDGALPGASDFERRLMTLSDEGGLEMVSSEGVAEDGVEFALWVLIKRAPE